ncbi:hypothetical protein N656DRAFT_771571 [Canariomyces notabilis]|uniref:SRR1-like domain-containing protein n=1 Tax=Canariomyces notabilis TaxID=2074819 RepID=A0AAN6T9J9_9PEZI|nr:hypothetical protein N656DRAFT_771571 [Canariomyces arenarius]
MNGVASKIAVPAKWDRQARLTAARSPATIYIRSISEMALSDYDAKLRIGIRPLYPLWIKPQPPQPVEDSLHMHHDLAVEFASEKAAWDASPACNILIKTLERVHPKPAIDKIIAFGFYSRLIKEMGALAQCSALLTIRDAILNESHAAVRVMVHGPSYSPRERRVLMYWGIDTVTDREAIMAIDRRSVVVDVQSDMPVMDVVADFPEKPAIILTNRFTFWDDSPRSPHPNTWDFLRRNYKLAPLWSTLKFGVAIPFFEMFFRKDPRNRASWAPLEEPLTFQEAVEYLKGESEDDEDGGVAVQHVEDRDKEEEGPQVEHLEDAIAGVLGNVSGG